MVVRGMHVSQRGGSTKVRDVREGPSFSVAAFHHINSRSGAVATTYIKWELLLAANHFV